MLRAAFLGRWLLLQGGLAMPRVTSSISFSEPAPIAEGSPAVMWPRGLHTSETGSLGCSLVGSPFVPLYHPRQDTRRVSLRAARGGGPGARPGRQPRPHAG